MLNAEKAHELTKTKKHITGTVDLKSTGKAYITPDDGGEDIFIAANNVNHALNKDIVKVFVFPKRRGHKIEGQVVEVIKRTKDTYVGILEVGKNFGFVIPDSYSMPYDIFIPKSQMSTGQNGQKVVAKITEWPEHSNNPFGEVIESLGKPGEHDVEMKSILVEYNFPLSFPKNVEKEAEKIKAGIEGEVKKRLDFRDIFTITIDPFDAKDFE